MARACAEGRLTGAALVLSPVLFTLFSTFFAADARADGVSVYGTASVDGEMVPGHDLHVSSGNFMRTSSGIGGTLRLDSAVFYTGAGVGLGLRTRHLVIPLFSWDILSAAGGYDEERTSIDGSIVHVRPWANSLMDFGIGGFGYRADKRRWSFAATGRFGFNWQSAAADSVYGAGNEELGASQFSPYLRLDLEVCRRLDPLERVCLVASPNVYAYDQTFHGGVLSFRYELGQ